MVSLRDVTTSFIRFLRKYIIPITILPISGLIYLLFPSNAANSNPKESKDVLSLEAPASKEDIYHIFFVPGNPGLIDYYSTFLTLLHTQLNQSSGNFGAKTVAFEVFGRSLGGFEVASSTPRPKAFARVEPPYNVEKQIQFVHGVLNEYVEILLSRKGPASTKKKPKIIFLGHSLGTYILTDILQRIEGLKSSGDFEQKFDVAGAILLFPPIPSLAKSPKGLKVFGVSHSASAQSFLSTNHKY